MSKNIGIVPVRIGSKSIPKKNIKYWHGKPLLFWVCDALEKSIEIDEFYILSDSEEINNIFNNLNFTKGKIFNRSKKNAQDFSSTEDVVIEFLNSTYLDNVNIILCQATSPYLNYQDINNAIQIFENSEYNSLLSVVDFKRFIWDSNGNSVNYNFENRPRRQDAHQYYMENGALYISKSELIKKQKNRLITPIGYYIMDDFDDFELDEIEDWKKSEYLFKLNQVQNENKKTYSLKLFISDIDGTLTDGGMYYDENGEVYKKFNTKDGMGFELLRNNNIKTALITSENSLINIKRANKLKIDYLIQGEKNEGKLKAVMTLCEKLNIRLEEVAYIGDDINCFEILNAVGYPACPSDANSKIKNIPNIDITNEVGGNGCVREYIDKLINKHYEI